MSHQTPRQTPRKKQQHNRNPSSSLATRVFSASDYESDTVQYNPTMGAAAPGQSARLVNRTNTEMNIGVLQRYLPSIHSIYGIAPQAVVYTYLHNTSQWEKTGVEGTMFVCSQQPGASGGERACVFVLNRRGLDNVVVDLARVEKFENSDGLLNFCLDDGDGGLPDARVIGLWMGVDGEDSRRTNGELIAELWRKIRGAAIFMKAARGGMAESEAESEDASFGPAIQAIGRRLSLTELFARASDDT